MGCHKKNYKKYKFHRYKSQKPQNPIKSHKREIGCFKCGQKEHIAPNCRKQKINVLSDSEEDYYSEESTSSLSESDNSQNKNPILEKEHNQTDKIENCLCQVNVLTADQELLIEMIDQIEDKEVKAKYIRKIMEQSSKSKNYVPLSNTYRFKDIIQQFEVQEPIIIQDLQTEIKQIKIQIEELKNFSQHLDFKIQNIENKKVFLTPQTSEDLDIFVNSMTIVQK